ncbi:MAG: TonB-dependent receptor [Candidatus Marinimicrobia bacterium]|jgi:TonB-dependent receptor|nr:TonB-dependent receptor [Candidatus Neomarinimicrobiota bacterium]MBT6631658.1 TonB-dependent receptor [Candidatus Neomarinimicrobiota bacterium]MBT6862136.1 TonB-dependent receptor [Candidatus Neomarinimicrobiota bacterium]
MITSLTKYKCIVSSLSFLTILMTIPEITVAQSNGKISGNISDAESGDYLPGANVFLDGTNYGASSDRAGNYTILGVSEGSYTLKVSYVGYSDYLNSVTVGSDPVIEDAKLSVSYVALGAVNVSGLAQGQSKALNQQKSSGSIKNIVSSEMIERFPDQNVADALKRLPGVALETDHGEGRYVQIRGIEAQLNSTTLNGVKIPSPENSERKVSLDVIPSFLLGAIELSKAITPDMDADAIGGSVNLITKNAFDYDGRVMSLKVSGGQSTMRGKNAGLAAFNFADQFMDNKLGLIISSSYENRDMHTDNIELEWDDKYEYVTDVVDDPDDETFVVEEKDGTVLTDVQLRNYSLSRERIGLTANLDYKINANSKIYLRSIRNKYTDWEARDRLRFRLDKSVDEEEPGSGYDPSDGLAVTLGRLERDLKTRNSVSLINSYTLGGEHQIGKVGIDYSYTISHAEEFRSPSTNVTYEAKDVNMDYEFSDEHYPKLSNFTDDDGEIFDINDPSNFELDEIELLGSYIPNAKDPNGNITTDDDQILALNLSMDVSVGPLAGKIKAGIKMSNKQKMEDRTGNEIWGWDGDDDLTMSDLTQGVDGENFMDGNYTHTLGIDVDKVRDHMATNIDDYEIFPAYEDVFFKTWDANESLTAFYGMADMRMGKMNIIAGARVENTSIEYNSWNGDIAEIEDAEGTYEESLELVTKVNSKSDNSLTLPMVHLRYNVNEKLLVRLAYTESLARPNYGSLVPFVIADDDEAEIGNPDLKPAHAKNIDMMLEYYAGPLGVLSFGYFSKDIANYFYEGVFEDYTVLGKEYAEVVMPANGEGATLSGWEINLQQQLTFLPGILSGFGIYANFTSTTSDANYGSNRENTTLPGQAGSTGNLSLSYETKKLSTRLSYAISDKYIVKVGGGVDEDVYYEPSNRVDVSLSYNPMKNLTLLADLMNLNNAPLGYYQGSESTPIQRELYGPSFRMGFQYDF